MSSDTYLIFTTMKNEGPYILEWVAYYKSLGIDEILIYTNDCSDGTDLIVKRLQEMALSTHIDNSLPPNSSPQNTMLRIIRRNPKFKAADWVFCLDVDEYLNIYLPQPTIPNLIAKLEETVGSEIDVASFAWKLFGCSGITKFKDKPITQQFFLCDHPKIPHSDVAQGFKSIIRNNGKFRRFGPHRPKDHLPSEEDNIKWCDASGRLMPVKDVTWRADKNFKHDFARIHHYAVRSVDGFLVKRDRGKTNRIFKDQNESYWNNMNANSYEDRSILPAVENAEPLRQHLMNDPILSDLHSKAVAWHKSKINDLYLRKDWDDFRQFLMDNLIS